MKKTNDLSDLLNTVSALDLLGNMYEKNLAIADDILAKQEYMSKLNKIISIKQSVINEIENIVLGKDR